MNNDLRKPDPTKFTTVFQITATLKIPNNIGILADILFGESFINFADKI